MGAFPKRGLLPGLLLLSSLVGVSQPDSIYKVADPRLRITQFRTFFMGKNYRSEWMEPVKVPVLDLNGLNITALDEGGGKETKSLHIDCDSGKQFSLRSVEKFPENAIPPELRKTIAEKLTLDGLSASYPYGALSMAIFSQAVHVPFYRSQLTYIPDDSVLGKYRSKYKNTLVLMEDSKDPVTGDSSDDKIKLSVPRTSSMNSGTVETASTN